MEEKQTNDFTIEQDLERHKRWLEDLNIRYKELVDRATPMKVIKLEPGIYACPHDVESIKNGYFVRGAHKTDYWFDVCFNQRIVVKLEFCGTCGQALDWSDSND